MHRENVVFFSKQVVPGMCSHEHFLHYQLASKMNKPVDLGLQTPALTFGGVWLEKNTFFSVQISWAQDLLFSVFKSFLCLQRTQCCSSSYTRIGVLKQNKSTPQGTSGNVGRHFWLLQPGERGESDNNV